MLLARARAPIDSDRVAIGTLFVPALSENGEGIRVEFVSQARLYGLRVEDNCWLSTAGRRGRLRLCATTYKHLYLYLAAASCSARSIPGHTAKRAAPARPMQFPGYPS